MKKLILTLALFTLLSSACKKEKKEINQEIQTTIDQQDKMNNNFKEDIVGKWKVASSSNLKTAAVDISEFEFFNNGFYLIYEGIKITYSGMYALTDSTLSLEGFGTMEILLIEGIDLKANVNPTDLPPFTFSSVKYTADKIQDNLDLKA